MKKFALTIGVFATLAFPALASAMTDAECTVAWTKADANGDGLVTAAEGPRYIASLRVAERPVVDGKMSQATFIEHCKLGHFNAVRSEAGAPHPGSNSFTEGQASDRAVAAGLTGVSALKKDDKGVWRGTALDGTNNVSIAVDFKGNVVVK